MKKIILILLVFLLLIILFWEKILQILILGYYESSSLLWELLNHYEKVKTFGKNVMMTWTHKLYYIILLRISLNIMILNNFYDLQNIFLPNCARKGLPYQSID